jgi:peroxiredoxin (alkyl hydroperoxide reductase subunit C)
MEQENEYEIPMIGDTFPTMSVNTTRGVKKLPDDYKGKWLILFSHPGDFTPVCTTEFIAFSEQAENLKSMNADLIALSVDQLQAHLKWVQWINENTETKVAFPIIDDSTAEISNRLGMINPRKGTKSVRKLFIIDPNGVIRLTMTYPAEAGRSLEEITRALYALQMSDKYKLAAPENYPNNNWMQDNMILPPPQTEDDIMHRLQGEKNGQYTCLDWWFCYKKPNS